MALILFAASLLAFLSLPQSDHDRRTAVLTALKETAGSAFLNRAIAQALEQGSIDEAVRYRNLSAFLQIGLDAELLSRVAEQNSGWQRHWRSARQAANGFVGGEMDGPAGIAGAIAADLTPWGDLRDFALQTRRWLSGQDIDTLLYGLSIAGLAATAFSYASAGAAEPVDFGIAVVKNGKKAGYLSQRLLMDIGLRLSRIIDADALKSALKRVDWRHPVTLKIALRAGVDGKKLRVLADELAAFDTIKRRTGSLADTLEVARYADDLGDVKRLGRLADDFGENTLAVVKVLGKRALTIGNWTAKRLSAMLALLLSALYALLSMSVSFLTFIGLLRRRSV